MIRNGAVVRILFREISMFLRSKMNRKRLLFIFFVEGRCCNVANRLWEKSDISTLRNGKRNANGANVVVLIVLPLKSIVKDQMGEMEEIGIPSIALSTKDDVLLLIGEAKCKLVFGAVEDFLHAKFENMLKNEDSLLHNCVMLIVVDEFHR